MIDHAASAPSPLTAIGLEEQLGGIGEAYSASQYQRLVELKKRYDPENLFRRNQNIPPN